MNSANFLKTVWPESGHYCIAIKRREENYYRHYVFDNIADAVDKSKRENAQERDVYFTIGSLAEPRVWDARKRDGAGGWAYRVKSNMYMYRSIYCELDVGFGEDSAHKYASQVDALEALAKFCDDLGWPKPSMVCSGRGIHVYWTLTTDIDAETYVRVSEKFKVVAKSLGLRIDTQAADMCRVFRVPGTHNYKYLTKPLKVQVWASLAPTDVADLEAALDKVIASQSLKIGATFKALPVYLQFGRNLQLQLREPIKLKPVLKNCAAIQEFVDNPDVPYKVWYHSLQVLRLVKDGDELCHTLSARSDNYSEAETDKMLASLAREDAGPTLCSRMAQYSTKCAGCPHFGKIKTPASFGMAKVPQAQQPQAQLAAATGTIPDPPFPYSCDSKGVRRQETDEKTGVQSEVEIYPYELRPIRRVHDESTKQEMYQWQTKLPIDGTVEFMLPAHALYDKRTFSGALANAGVLPKQSRVVDLQNYMLEYSRHLQQLRAAEVQHARMGWRDDTFVVGNTVVSASGSHTYSVVNPGRVLTAVSRQGTLADWRGIADTYNAPEFVAHQFAVCVGFAAPLMRFTGQQGGVINLLGVTGEGKSTVQKIVNSIWGDPQSLMLPADSSVSTYNAKLSFLSTMQNLPICAEEITNIDPEELGSLLYAITQGSERWRAQKDGSLRDKIGGWCTIMLTSSNASLVDKLPDQLGVEAKGYRILEYRLPKVGQYTLSEFQQRVDFPLTQHYGHAGLTFAQHVVRNLPAVRGRVQARMASVVAEAGCKPEARIWAALVASVIEGGALAAEAGVVGYDPAQLHRYGVGLIQSCEAEVRNMAGPRDYIAEFLAECLDGVLVVKNAAGKPLVVKEAHRNACAVVDYVSKAIYISKSALRDWRRKKRISVVDILPKNVPTCGYDILGYTQHPAGQTSCYKLPLRGELTSAVEVSSQNNVVSIRNGKVS